MKPFPNKRVVWLIIPLVPVVLMTALLWYAGRPDSEAIANRGAEAPPEKRFSLVDPRSWSVSMDWFDDGMDAVMEWDYNPWKGKWKRDNRFGQRIDQLAKSDRPEDKAELERLRKLGREWYERILARYPDLVAKPGRDIPREQNGFFQWQSYLKRLSEGNEGGIFESSYSKEMVDHLRRGAEPDLAAIKAWLDANRERIDEIRGIGLISDRSTAGMTQEELKWGGIMWSRNASDALMLDARASVADGDIARALESIRALSGLADHVSTSPDLVGMIVAGQMRADLQIYVMSELLPAAGNVDVAAWEAAMNLRLRSPSEVAAGIRTDWNQIMPGHLLPILSDTADPHTPRDGDYFAETYTRHMLALIQQAEGASLADYGAGGKVETSVELLSRRSREIGMVNEWDPRVSFMRQQEFTGLTQAAFAILKGEPVPVDPVYGKPYKWDPVKRWLTVPDVPNRLNYQVKPIRVPKM